LSYREIIRAIRTGEGLFGTIETDPAYGKYHYDGHRKCNVVLSPEEAERIRNKCPVCGRTLTIGVLHRVNILADRKKAEFWEGHPKIFRLIPLTELIASYLKTNDLNSEKVWKVYNSLISYFGNELEVLLRAQREELLKVVDEKLSNIILDNRDGRLKIAPGYDGVYGRIILEGEENKIFFRKQRNLLDF
jgi:PHP family Zn ribbon phosphoesterase